MEQTPRITSVFEKENEQRRKEQLRAVARRRAMEARKKAITALAIMRALVRIAATPNRDVQRRIVRGEVRLAKEGARIITGRRGRLAAFGRRVLLAR